MFWVLLVILLGIIGFAVFLYFYQGRMIYFPRTYSVQDHALLDADVAVIKYKTSSGAQYAYYKGPERPAELWVMFGGNAELAINWLGFTDSLGFEACGFLLVDYPGYGACEGTPTRAGILESQREVLGALARHLEVDEEELHGGLNTMGYSLGAAAALDFAAMHPVRKVVLCAPFTSLMDMAKRQVGWPLMYLLRDRFDNRVRLDELEKQSPRPAVTIIHGTADRVIPFRMGEELARAHPEMVTFHAIDGGGHNDLLDVARGEIVAAIR